MWDIIKTRGRENYESRYRKNYRGKERVWKGCALTVLRYIGNLTKKKGEDV